jgi:hypothetical protein
MEAIAGCPEDEPAQNHAQGLRQKRLIEAVDACPQSLAWTLPAVPVHSFRNAKAARRRLVTSFCHS